MPPHWPVLAEVLVHCELDFAALGHKHSSSCWIKTGSNVQFSDGWCLEPEGAKPEVAQALDQLCQVEKARSRILRFGVWDQSKPLKFQSLYSRKTGPGSNPPFVGLTEICRLDFRWKSSCAWLLQGFRQADLSKHKQAAALQESWVPLKGKR